MSNSQQTPYGPRAPKRYDRHLPALAVHFSLYGLIMLFLLFVNVVTGFWPPWFLWPVWVWGFGLAAHVGNVLAPRPWLGAHIAVTLWASLGFFLINLVSMDTIWFVYPILALGLPLAAHVGALATNRRWLGAHIGVVVWAVFGFFIIDLLDPGGPWWFFPAFGLAVTVLIHAGVSVMMRPPTSLADITPTEFSPTATSPRASAGIPTVSPDQRLWVSEAPAAGDVLGRTRGTVAGALASWVSVAFAVVVVLVAAGTGFVDAIGVHGSGQPGVRVWDDASFDRVVIHGRADVTIEVGPEPRVIIEGDDNIIQHVRTSVSGGELRLSLHSRFRSLTLTRPLRYRIIAPNLVRIRATDRVRVEQVAVAPGETLRLVASDQSFIWAGEITVDRLIIEAEDSAFIQVSGAADTANVALRGTARFDGAQFETTVAQVITLDAARAEVWAHDSLDARAEGVSQVRYRGEPVVEPTIRDSGTVERLDEEAQPT